MEHLGTVLIETERLRLRRFRIEDSEAAFRNWTHDSKVTEYLRWPTHTSIEVTEKVIKDWIASYQDTTFYQWAIELKGIEAKCS